MYKLKKMEGYYEYICWDRALVLWKKNLKGRGLTKVEKHCFRVRPVRPEPDNNLLPMLVVQKFATVLRFNTVLTAVLMWLTQKSSHEKQGGTWLMDTEYYFYMLSTQCNSVLYGLKTKISFLFKNSSLKCL
jgi:hypothetical protein